MCRNIEKLKKRLKHRLGKAAANLSVEAAVLACFARIIKNESCKSYNVAGNFSYRVMYSGN
jgi:hypothetical protein